MTERMWRVHERPPGGARGARGPRWSAVAAIVLTAAAGLSTPSASAADFDLRAAVASAADGDTITVPPGIYQGPLVIDRPITLIAGGKVVNAWSSGQMFRGIEIILRGRDPRDAPLFVQRSCGV